MQVNGAIPGGAKGRRSVLPHELPGVLADRVHADQDRVAGRQKWLGGSAGKTEPKGQQEGEERGARHAV